MVYGKIIANARLVGKVKLLLNAPAPIKSCSKTVVPNKNDQMILPDPGYDYLNYVTVSAIPYEETDNSAGGKTVSIAG